jgi:oxygen-independent coproporphyrinogen-3 oxidase
VGVQDFDQKVQFIINRHQTFEQTQYIIETARKIGYTSVNIDIIYGLPLQTKESVGNTIEKIQLLQPDRIAFYSYAHVPWKSAAQRRYTEEDLPKAEEKRALYELGKNALMNMSYEEIGFDHFALAKDGLALAAKRGTLHRNFMGYTEQNTNILIGLGCSSISDLGCSFGQNVREVEEYQEIVGKGLFPIQKGHLLTAEDKIIQQHILNLMCNGQTSWHSEEFFTPFLAQGLTLLKELEADGLVNVMHNSIKVTAIGKQFLRNICVCLDARLQNKNQTAALSNAKMFSQSA